MSGLATNMLGNLDHFALALRELCLGVPFDSDELVARAANRSDQFVELEVDCLRIPVLRRLDHEHHEEGHDRGAGVDHELPGIRETEHRPGDCPDDDDERCHEHRERRAGHPRDPAGGVRKDVPERLRLVMRAFWLVVALPAHVDRFIVATPWHMATRYRAMLWRSRAAT
jgi:hypothetical protein